MENKKRIMLAAYVNYPNAQNINCDNIAKNLDKSKFDIHSLYLGGFPIDRKFYKKQGITLHYVNPHRLLHNITLWKTLIFGNYDIYYMPKTDPAFRWFANNFGSKRLLVSSIEGVITDKNISDNTWYKNYMINHMYDVFSISYCISESVEKFYQKKTEVIPLGVKNNTRINLQKNKYIHNIIWCGSLIKRKRPHLLLEVAKKFPKLQFVMVGDGILKNEVKQMIESEYIENVILTGRITNEKVYEYMEKADLLLMTSEFEGLPKVIQEAAQYGVPSIYMANNYTVDFIKNGVNGYAVYSIDEMNEKIQFLIEHPEIYHEMSSNAKKVIAEYSWDRLIVRYEEWFLDRLDSYKAEKEK